MLPYFLFDHLSLGPFTIHVWGLLVAIGILAGAFAAVGLARKRGLDEQLIWNISPWVILGAFVGARLFHVFLYEPAYFFANPSEILAFWKGGLSVTGGLIGAMLVGLLVLKRRHLDVLAYADVMVFGLPLGTFIGRLGCFVTHLHPGKPTDFFLGVLYPDGVVRHDLGLYLSLDGLLLFLVFLWMAKKRLPTGSFVVGYLLWYGVSRFILDFYRATEGPIVDARYLGLTPAQYLSVFFVGAGMIGLFKLLDGFRTSARS